MMNDGLELWEEGSEEELVSVSTELSNCGKLRRKIRNIGFLGSKVRRNWKENLGRLRVLTEIEIARFSFGVPTRSTAMREEEKSKT